jgi:anti-sigma B factor antagonist
VKANTRQTGSVTIIDLNGRITLGEDLPQLRQLIRDLLAQGHKNILLNLAEVSYIDSAGLGELVSANVAAANRGGQLKLLHLTKRVRDLLQITKLLTVFDAHEDEAEAIASFPKAAGA